MIVDADDLEQLVGEILSGLEGGHVVFIQQLGVVIAEGGIVGGGIFAYLDEILLRLAVLDQRDLDGRIGVQHRGGQRVRGGEFQSMGIRVAIGGLALVESQGRAERHGDRG